MAAEIPRFKVDVILWHAIERLNKRQQTADLWNILKELKSNGRMLTEKEILASLEHHNAYGQNTKNGNKQYAVA